MIEWLVDCCIHILPCNGVCNSRQGDAGKRSKILEVTKGSSSLEFQSHGHTGTEWPIYLSLGEPGNQIVEMMRDVPTHGQGVVRRETENVFSDFIRSLLMVRDERRGQAGACT